MTARAVAARTHRQSGFGMPARLACALLLGMAPACGALAYEDDVHYGLTKWLALVAGMTPRDAEIVATGNREIDGGALDAVRLVYYNACVGRDKVGSELVRDHHFPSFAKMPGPPATRVVKEGSNAARTPAEDRIVRPNTNGQEEQDWNLQRFGAALHLFQDSYSHQGEPEIPGLLVFRCSSDLAWGHPAARGHWDSHDADLTFKDPATAARMAQGTYDLICSYRARVQKSPCTKSSGAIKAAVDRFIAADTKLAKWAWFSTGNEFKASFACEFLAEINLPDGTFGDWCPQLSSADVDRSEKLAPQNNPLSPEIAMSRNPAAFVQAALDTWFVKRDVFSLVNFYLDRDAFKEANALSDFGERSINTAAVNKFATWLVRDHGMVSSQLKSKGPQLLDLDKRFGGATMIWPGAAEFRPDKTSFVAFSSGTKLVQYRSLNEAFFEIGPDARLFDVRTGPCAKGDGTCALAAARLRKAPYETLLLELKYTNTGWKIMQKWPLVDH